MNMGGPSRSALFVAPCLHYTTDMTNRIAIGLFILIVGFFVLDHFVLHLDAATFLMRELVDLINAMAFWR